MIDWMADKGVELVEQPMPASMFEDYKWLKERSKLPIFADESMMTARDIPRLVQGFHGINIKLMKCGGIQEALRMVAIARALGLKLMIGCMVETRHRHRGRGLDLAPLRLRRPRREPPHRERPVPGHARGTRTG